MREAFVRALTEIAGADPTVMLVNGDLGFGVLTDFIARFPENYVNAGVAEQNMTAVACGMALAGARAYTGSAPRGPSVGAPALIVRRIFSASPSSSAPSRIANAVR